MCLECTYNCNQFEDAAAHAIQKWRVNGNSDGGPLSTVGQKRGHKNMERTTGPV